MSQARLNHCIVSSFKRQDRSVIVNNIRILQNLLKEMKDVKLFGQFQLYICVAILMLI